MKKRRIRIAFLGIVVAFAVLFVFIQFGPAGSDDTSYRRSVRHFRLAGSIRTKCEWLPGPVVWPLDRLRRKAFDIYYAKEQSLLASGFLTNLSLTLSNASERFGTSSNSAPPAAEIARRLKAAVPENDWLPYTCRADFQRNQVYVTVTCPVRDAPRLIDALQSY